MSKYRVAGQSLVGFHEGQAKLLQCNEDGVLLVKIENVKLSVLNVSTLTPTTSSSFTPHENAKKLIINANPANTGVVKYGTSTFGRRLYLKAGETIVLPATALSFESVGGTHEIGIIQYG